MVVSDSVCLYGRILRQRQQQQVCKTFPGQVCRRRVLHDEGDLPICRRGAADHHLCEKLTSFAACQQVLQLAGVYEQLHPLRARNGTRRDDRHLAYRHFTIIIITNVSWKINHLPSLLAKWFRSRRCSRTRRWRESISCR